MPDADIHLYESGQTASFLSLGIQSYIEDASKSLDELHYANEMSYKKQGVNVHVNSEVTNINPDQNTVTVKTSSGEKEESYDKLFLIPGAVPRSEEHTSELQSRGHLVCRLLLEKKKINNRNTN